jgi:hypothetical protein
MTSKLGGMVTQSHCYLCWRWWFDILWESVGRLWPHSLSFCLQSVVVRFSLQSCTYVAKAYWSIPQYPHYELQMVDIPIDHHFIWRSRYLMCTLLLSLAWSLTNQLANINLSLYWVSWGVFFMSFSYFLCLLCICNYRKEVWTISLLVVHF